MNFHKRHTIVISKEHSFGYHYHFRIDQFIDVQNLNSNYVRMAAGFVVTTMVALAARTAVELLVCLRRNHRDPQHVEIINFIIVINVIISVEKHHTYYPCVLALHTSAILL